MAARKGEAPLAPSGALQSNNEEDLRNLGKQLRQVVDRRAKGSKQGVGARKETLNGLRQGGRAASYRASRGTLAEGREELQKMIFQLEHLPRNSRFAQHRLKCARKALQLMDIPG